MTRGFFSLYRDSLYKIQDDPMAIALYVRLVMDAGYSDSSEFGVGKLKINKKNLSSQLGITRQMLYRKLDVLRRKGLISSGHFSGHFSGHSADTGQDVLTICDYIDNRARKKESGHFSDTKSDTFPDTPYYIEGKRRDKNKGINSRARMNPQESTPQKKLVKNTNAWNKGTYMESDQVDSDPGPL